MKKLEKYLTIFLAVQILVTASVTDESNSQERKENYNVNAVVEESVQQQDDNEDDAVDSRYVELNNKPKHGEVQVLTNIRKHKQKETHNTAEKFKYVTDSKEESGFDLTPEEIKKFKIWKDGVIPYYIDVVSFSDKVLRDKIRNFLQMVNSATSINFVELPGPPSDDNERWVFFINRRGLLGCADHTVKNFSNQGVQQVVLGYDCIATRGEMAEAVMSIVGVPAQHNAPDRDKYIEVNMDNIIPDKKYLFEKLNDDEWLFQDLAYDLNSVTHYDIHKYSANGRATIKPKKTADDINPATDFSHTDLQKIKILYNFITRSKNMQTPVCEKLFKISHKNDQELLRRIKPRPRPRPYTGKPDRGPSDLPDLPTPNEKSNEETETKILNNYDDDTQANDDENSDSGAKKNNGIQKLAYEEGKKRLKYREKSKKMVDILAELSDYVSDEKKYKKSR